VLDMYYSDRGVSFDNEIKACRRNDLAKQFVPMAKLKEQVIDSDLACHLIFLKSLSDNEYSVYYVCRVEKTNFCQFFSFFIHFSKAPRDNLFQFTDSEFCDSFIQPRRCRANDFRDFG